MTTTREHLMQICGLEQHADTHAAYAPDLKKDHPNCGTPECCGECDTAEDEVTEKKSESWEAGYKRRVVKTTSAEHKADGYNWRIKGKERPEISIKLYKSKPDQAEFNKQMKRVAGHEFGG
jgi:hypothetical protein